MFRLSDKLAKLEDRIAKRWGKKIGLFLDRRKGKWKLYIPLVLCGWYFYGMFVNSIRLGIESTFGENGDAIATIWVVNPFSIRCLLAHRPGGDSLLFSDVLPSHQKGLFLVFRLQVHP